MKYMYYSLYSDNVRIKILSLEGEFVMIPSINARISFTQLEFSISHCVMHGVYYTSSVLQTPNAVLHSRMNTLPSVAVSSSKYNATDVGYDKTEERDRCC